MGSPRVCPLCGCSEARTRFRLRTYEVARCRRCGCDYNPSFRGGGGSDGTFSRDYFLVDHRDAFEPLVEDPDADPSIPVFERRLEQIEERLGRGRLLDVGPGLGTFLRLARDRGWQVEGVEISEFAAGHMRQAHGLDVFHGDLGAFRAAPGSYDLVTFWDSLEHVGEPRRDLAAAYRLLRPSGLLLVTTDNFDCLVADLAAAAYRVSLGTLRYPVERVFIDRNFGFFTATTLSRLVAGEGFRELWREKMEYPLDKISLGTLERLALGAVYAAAAVTGRQAQVTLLAERPAGASAHPDPP